MKFQCFSLILHDSNARRHTLNGVAWGLARLGSATSLFILGFHVEDVRVACKNTRFAAELLNKCAVASTLRLFPFDPELTGAAC